MIINHRTAQLGVVNQRRPEVWQSYLVPQLQQEDVGKISLAIGDHKLKDTLYRRDIIDGTRVTLSISDHKLIDPTKVVTPQDGTQITLSVGDHKLIDPTKTAYGTENVGSVSLGIGNHRLYIWGVRAEVLDEDNVKVSLAIGDHKLYEEQS